MLKERLTLTIVMVLFTTVHGYSQTSDASEPDPQQPIFQRLGLSADQLQKIRSINRRQRPKLQQANLAVERARLALDEAIYADEVSEDRMKEALARFNRAQVDLANLRMQTEFEIRKILTPDQLNQFREMRGSRQTRRPPPPQGRPRANRRGQRERRF